MARLYLQVPEMASDHFLTLNKEVYRNFILLQHTWASLSRGGATVFCLGALLGIIPLGFRIDLMAGLIRLLSLCDLCHP